MTEEQRIAELLKPRYKVVADYPGNRDFPVGKIIEFHPWESCRDYWEHSVEDCQGKRSWLEQFFIDYPNIFHKCDWWENREPNEMPEYLVFHRNGNVVKPYDIDFETGYFYLTEEEFYNNEPHLLVDVQPATKTQNINSKQQP